MEVKKSKRQLFLERNAKWRAEHPEEAHAAAVKRGKYSAVVMARRRKREQWEHGYVGPELTHEQRVEMGKKGGGTTKARYGHDYYVGIGKKGGKVRADRVSQRRAKIAAANTDDTGIVSARRSSLPSVEPETTDT